MHWSYAFLALSHRYDDHEEEVDWQWRHSIFQMAHGLWQLSLVPRVTWIPQEKCTWYFVVRSVSRLHCRWHVTRRNQRRSRSTRSMSRRTSEMSSRFVLASQTSHKTRAGLLKRFVIHSLRVLYKTKLTAIHPWFLGSKSFHSSSWYVILFQIRFVDQVTNDTILVDVNDWVRVDDSSDGWTEFPVIWPAIVVPKGEGLMPLINSLRPSNMQHHGFWSSFVQAMIGCLINTKPFLNPLRAKFFRRNINIHLHFVSFLHIDTTQVLEILPQIRQEPTYST